VTNAATVRDEILGAALRQLEVPEHRPDFHARLHYLLAEERRARRAEEHRRTRTRRRRVLWTIRLAAAAAVVSAAAVIGFPHTDTGPHPATAAEVQARVAGALASVRTMSGEIAYHATDPLTGTSRTRWSFALTAKGDFRLRQANGGSDVAYDAAHGVQRSLNQSASIQDEATLFGAETKGLAPGRPDPGPSDWLLQRDLGAVVRAVRAANDPRVETTTYEGRPAWRLDVPVPTNAIYPDADRFEITVDQETGIPVLVVATLDGKFKSELRVENLAVDPRLAHNAFTLSFPSDVSVEESDFGFRRVSLDEVEDVVGYGPLVPASVPDGYRLAEVAVAKRSGSTGVEAMNPRSRDVVSLSYRRGLDQFIVTTRLRHVARYPDMWSDPLATGEGFRDEPEKITLEGGELAGLTADLLIVPRNVPHLWTLTDNLVITVSGDLSRAELLSVAQSLQSRS
jgi:outer membrane lipoprotein-sorting protein